MNKLRTGLFFSLILLFAVTVHAQVKKHPVKKTTVTKNIKKASNTPKMTTIPGTRVKITTDSGVIVIRLYDKTPKHRDNFIKLAMANFFDSLLFHRVIYGFMIQGGDPQSKNAPAGAMLGNGDVGYTIPAEFDTSLYHKKGALAAARTDNPEKASSGCQFYIVQGKISSDADLNNVEMRNGFKYSPQQREVYKTIGGTPFLDQNYTVFGEMESGFEVIDKISGVAVDGLSRPLVDVRMKIEVVKDKNVINTKKNVIKAKRKI